MREVRATLFSQHPKIATQERESWSYRSHPHVLTALPQQFPPRLASQTKQMLEEVFLLRGGSLNVRPAQLRNPTLFLGKAL